MKKSLLLAITASAMLASSISASQAAASSDNKFKSGAKAVGRGIMWGPKKIGEGFKKLGSGTKKLFHKGS